MGSWKIYQQKIAYWKKIWVVVTGEWVSVWSPDVLTTQAWLELSYSHFFNYLKLALKNKEIDFIYTGYSFGWEQLYKGSKLYSFFLLSVLQWHARAMLLEKQFIIYAQTSMSERWCGINSSKCTKNSLKCNQFCD